MGAFGLGHDSPSSYHSSKIDGEISTSIGKTARESLPEVRILPNTCSVDEVVDALKVCGGVVIKNAVAHEDVDRIES